MNTKSKISLLSKIVEFNGPFVSSLDISPGDSLRDIKTSVEFDTNLNARKFFQALKDSQFGANLEEAIKGLNVPHNKNINRILVDLPALSSADLTFEDPDLRGLAEDPWVPAALAGIDTEKGYLAALQHAPAISGLADGMDISKLIDHVASNPNGELATALSGSKDPTEILARYNLPGISVWDAEVDI